MKKALVPSRGDSGKASATSIVLIANAFIWYSYAFSYLTKSITLAGLTSDFLLIMAIHFLGLFSAVIFGEFVSRRIKRRISFLLIWMLVGVLLSLVPLITLSSTYMGVLLFSLFSGVSFGFGIPTCLGYFASATGTSNRGRLSGITFMLIGIGAFLLNLLGNESCLTVATVLAVWRALGLIIVFSLRSPEKQKPKQTNYRMTILNRTFLLYFVPWAMFLLVNSLAFPVIEKQFTPDLVRFSSNIEFILAGISAVIFGFLADSIGRKKLIVFGFALLGSGYGVLGFTSGNIVGWWFYTFIDGIAWGCFAMIFIFTLWGDMAEDQSSEKFYAIGILPYLISTFLRFSIGTFVANAITDSALIFSYASFFLFVAVLPLVIAPETLPEKAMKDRDLKSYLDKAQKFVEKESEKNQKKETKKKLEEPIQSKEETDDGKEFDEAKKLAEKYY